MQSLPAGSCPQAYSPTHKLKPVERRVLGDPEQEPVLQRFRACRINNAQYRTVVGLKQETVKELIPEEHQQALREKSLRQWVIRHFEPVSDQTPYDSGWARSLSEPSRLPVITSAIDQEQLTAADPVQAFVMKTPEGYPGFSKQTITIPLPSVAGNGKQLVLFNGNAADDLRQIDIGIACSSRKVSLSQSVWLNKGDAVVLESHVDDKGHEQWRVVARKVDNRVKLETNPLVRTSGEIQVSENKTAASQPYDGEFFMPLHTLQGVLEHKLAKHEGFDWACCEDEQAVCTYLQTLKQRLENNPHEQRCTGHFIFEDKTSNHTIAARIHVENGKVRCFIQDGMGCLSTDALRVRKKVIAQMQKVFPDARMVIGTPSESFQLDYESCGVIAAKAMTFFAKHGEELDAQLEEMTLTDPGQVDIRELPLASLPAGLLKMCQIPEHLEGLQQLDNVVSQKQGTTLGEYLVSYRARMNDDTRATGYKWVEAAALAKRYQYFAELFGVTEKTSEIDEPMQLPDVSKPETPAKPKKARGKKCRIAAGERLKHIPGGTKGKFRPSILGPEFLFRMACDPAERYNVSWHKDDPYVCVVKDGQAVAEEWHRSTLGTDNFGNFARGLRHRYGKEMLHNRQKLHYRFNPDNPIVQSWRREFQKPPGSEPVKPVLEPVDSSTIAAPDAESQQKAFTGSMKNKSVGYGGRSKPNRLSVSIKLEGLQSVPGQPSEVHGPCLQGTDLDRAFSTRSEFLFYLVSSGLFPDIIRWENQAEGILKIYDSEALTDLCRQSGARAKNYRMLSRALRCRYEKGEFIHCDGHLRFHFNLNNDNVKLWKADCDRRYGQGSEQVENMVVDSTKALSTFEPRKTVELPVAITRPRVESLSHDPAAVPSSDDEEPSEVHEHCLQGTGLDRPYSSRSEFLFYLVSSGLFPDVIRWENQAEGILKIYNSEALADLFRQSGGRAKNYEMLARSLRFRYEKGEFIRCDGRLRFHFNLNNDSVKLWKADCDKRYGQSSEQVEKMVVDSPKALSTFEPRENGGTAGSDNPPSCRVIIT